MTISISAESRFFQFSIITHRATEALRLYIQCIDASKGFVDPWVTFAIFANFDLRKKLKWLSTKI